MLTKVVNGQTVRKSSFSAMNDCVYPTSPTAAEHFIHDSKTEENLAVRRSARASLLRWVAGVGAAGILGILGANALTHDAPDARADVPVGSGSIQSEKDWFQPTGCLTLDGQCRTINW